MGRSEYDYSSPRPAWNAGRKVGAKRPLKPRQIWAIRFHLDREHRLRYRALFDLAIDNKLRGCDLVKIKIGDLVAGGEMRTRAIVTQQKTGRPVQFELMSDARGSLLALPNQFVVLARMLSGLQTSTFEPMPNRGSIFTSHLCQNVGGYVGVEFEARQLSAEIKIKNFLVLYKPCHHLHRQCHRTSESCRPVWQAIRAGSNPILLAGKAGSKIARRANMRLKIRVRSAPMPNSVSRPIEPPSWRGIL